MKSKIGFLLFVMMCVSLSSYAQSACDKLFANGVKFQQTMTIASQKKAISYFEKAKLCYDSSKNKDLCVQQIKASRSIIALISQGNKRADALKETEVVQSADSVEVKVETKQDVKLSIDCIYLKFKGKGGEFKKTKVFCNYPDWEITEIPSWVNCSRNEKDELVIEVEKNPVKKERSGILKIQCGDETATLTIIQEKMKKLSFL